VSDGSSTGVTTTHFSVDGKTPSRKDALNSAVMNGDMSPANRLTSHVGAGSSSQSGLVCRIRDETLHSSSVNWYKTVQRRVKASVTVGRRKDPSKVCHV